MIDASKRNRAFLALALALLVALVPATAFAQARGGRPGGGAVRSAAPVSRPVAVSRPVPVSRPVAGGFDFNHDIAPTPARRAAPVAAVAPQRAAAPERRTTEPVHVALPQRGPAASPPSVRAGARAPASDPARTAYAPPANYHRAQFAPNHTGGPYSGHFGGHPVRNPRFDGRQYGWNNGIAWRPAPIYWGGGFWGSFALADLSAAILFGSVLDAQNNVYYPSYQVEPDTPGYDILNDYGLQQVECGPSGIVEIWGPDDSVVCADPNAEVAAGNYEVDPATFTLVPAT
jgi:hypothetical protein